jgi:hypothetical protein
MGVSFCFMYYMIQLVEDLLTASAQLVSVAGTKRSPTDSFMIVILHYHQFMFQYARESLLVLEVTRLDLFREVVDPVDFVDQPSCKTLEISV